MAFPENLKRLREQSRLSQAELAEKCGVTQQAIDRYERDLMKPNVVVGAYLAQALCVTCEELLNGTQMKLYRLWQNDNNGYDTYDSAVVCAESEDEAKSIADTEFSSEPVYGSWVSADKVKCQLIGNAVNGMKKGIVVASFNAG